MSFTLKDVENIFGKVYDFDEYVVVKNSDGQDCLIGKNRTYVLVDEYFIKKFNWYYRNVTLTSNFYKAVVLHGCMSSLSIWCGFYWKDMKLL